jgi:hypothetical protein
MGESGIMGTIVFINYFRNIPQLKEIIRLLEITYKTRQEEKNICHQNV